MTDPYIQQCQERIQITIASIREAYGRFADGNLSPVGWKIFLSSQRETIRSFSRHIRRRKHVLSGNIDFDLDEWMNNES